MQTEGGEFADISWQMPKQLGYALKLIPQQMLMGFQGRC
jgi:hypothetical protein